MLDITPLGLILLQSDGDKEVSDIDVSSMLASGSLSVLLQQHCAFIILEDNIIMAYLLTLCF